MATSCISPEFNAGQRYLESRFARRAIDHFGRSDNTFREALDRTLDFFAAIERGDGLSSEALDLLGVFDHTEEEAYSVDEFLAIIAGDSVAFKFSRGGELYRAFEFGIQAGVRRIPDDAGCLGPTTIDYHSALGAIFFAIDYWEEDQRSPLETLVKVVEEQYGTLFEWADGSRFDGTNPCRAAACRAFWASFGISLDERDFPITWW